MIRKANMRKGAALVFAGLALLGCTPAADESSDAADLILIGKHIITMDESEVDAVAVMGGRIAATGTADDILQMQGPDTRVVELGDKALLPGFIDTHGHLAVVARLIDFANVSSPPVGSAGSIGDIQTLLRDAIVEKNIPPGEWVVGYGYDESLLEEKRHPTRDDLDAVSSEHPVILLHVSLHLVAANSQALAKHHIDASSAEPPGGRIRRRADSAEPNGVLEETAAQPLLLGLLHASSGNFADKARRALESYARYGITTAQDGAAVMPDVEAFRVMAGESPLPIDLVAYYHAMAMNDEQRATIEAEPYENGFRVGGAKFMLDGSIQGKTGYLSLPYAEPPDGKDADYRAYPMIPAGVFQDALDPLLQRNVPVLVHANGDAAIDMMIEGIATSFEGKRMPDHRTVMIHAQMMREDQLDRVKDLAIVPSYYSVHPFFWGDWHRQILGDERASRISPIRSTVDRGIPFTIHNDAPVVPSDVMRLIWITVNRKTRSGHVLGTDQRATVMEALHAVTQGAAYQYFEEQSKGSITPGKQADLVILGANPLTVDPDTLKDIPVIETISRGRTVYRSEGRQAARPVARVFSARKVITMDESETHATAVAVANGRILAVGSQESIRGALPDHELALDDSFASKILMPGFIDNHLHPSLAGILLPARFITPFRWELPSQQVEGVQGRDAYLVRLRELEMSLDDPDELLLTWGYHQYFHGGLTRADINEISASRPIIVWQRSFHEIIVNDAALETLDITAEEFGGHPAIDFANGHFRETGLLAVFAKLAPVVLDPTRFRRGVLEGLEHARRNGITTLCDQGVPLFDLDFEMDTLDSVIAQEKLPLRMFLIGNAKTLGVAGEDVAFETIEAMSQRNTDALTYLPKQVKLFADGAFFSQLMQMEGGYLDGHHGEWIMTPEELIAAARLYWRDDYQLHIHVNGDKGLDVVLDTVEQLLQEYPREAHGSVLHHLGFSRADQGARIAELGLSVSANPYYLWALGDKYAEIGLGAERAHHIARLGALEQKGVSLSLHSDLPMAPAAPLALAAIATSRQTAEDSVLAPEERISVETALRGITIEAARAIRQQASIGSIEVGKLADFTVLEQDPYDVRPENLKDISIWGTVLGGQLFPLTIN